MVEVRSGGEAWSSDLVKLSRLFQNFGHRMIRKRGSPMHRALTRAGRQWEGKMVRRFRGRAPGMTPPGAISRRSGALARSLNFRVFEDGQDLTLILYSTSPYARTQEYGAHIIPRSSTYLTIPGKDNLTPSGRVKYPSFRQWYATAKDGGDVLFEGLGFQKRGVRPKTVAVLFRANGLPRAKTMRQVYRQYKWMWTLTMEVTIRGPESTGEPSHLGFIKTWNSLRAARATLIRREMELGFKRATQQAASRPD